MVRIRTILALTLCVLGVSACPGRLSDPESYVGGPQSGPGVTCPLGVADVESRLMRPRCATSGCHDAASHSGDLDMSSAGLGARLLASRSDACGNRPLLDTNTLESSYFLVKLAGSPPCGSSMPLSGPALSPSELLCVRQWLGTLRPDAGTSMDVPAPTDVPTDRGATDAITDRTVTDVLDARADVTVDARADAPADVPMDVRADAGTDASPDVTVDVPADVRTMDASEDVGDAGPRADAADDMVDADDSAVDVGDDVRD